ACPRRRRKRPRRHTDASKGPKGELGQRTFLTPPLVRGEGWGEVPPLAAKAKFGPRPQPLRSPRLARALRVSSPSLAPWTRRGGQKLFRLRVDSCMLVRQ